MHKGIELNTETNPSHGLKWKSVVVLIKRQELLRSLSAGSSFVSASPLPVPGRETGRGTGNTSVCRTTWIEPNYEKLEI